MRILFRSRIIEDRHRPFPIFTLLALIVAGFALGTTLGILVITP